MIIRCLLKSKSSLEIFKTIFFNMLNATGDISYCRLGYPETDAEMEFGTQDTYPRSTPVGRRDRKQNWADEEVRHSEGTARPQLIQQEAAQHIQITSSWVVWYWEEMTGPLSPCLRQLLDGHAFGRGDSAAETNPLGAEIWRLSAMTGHHPFSKRI